MKILIDERTKTVMPWTGSPGPVLTEHDIDAFRAVLTYHSVERGRSACTFYFKEEDTGDLMPFRLTEFEKLIPLLENGAIYGHFEFDKKGTSISLKLIEKL